MEKSGCILIIICFIIASLIVAPFVKYIGDFGIPIIVILAFFLAKLGESILDK